MAATQTGTVTGTQMATASGSSTLSATATSLALPSAIAVAANGSAAELWAARMLSEQLGFPLRYLSGAPALDPGLAPGSVIAVGYGAAVAAGLKPQHLDSLRIDDFRVTNSRARGLRAGALAVSSGPSPTARGVLFGSYRFLRELGFRFWAPTATRVPPRPFALPPGDEVDILEQPPLALRDMSIGTVQNNRARVPGPNGTLVFLPVNHSAALGLNGANVNLPTGAFEGGNPDFSSHTALALLNPALRTDTSYLATQRPEWLVCRNATGQILWPCKNATLAAQAYNAHPCWSVPTAQAQLTASITALTRSQPGFVTLGVMDGQVATCPPDAAINAPAGQNCTGGANFVAVNNIAAALEVEFPQPLDASGVRVGLFAYNGAAAPPPKMRMRDDVSVMFSPGGVFQFADLHEPANAPARVQAEGWAAAASVRHVWDGWMPWRFTLAPWPNHFGLARRVISFARMGYRGYYAYGIQVLGSDMQDLKAFVWAAAMWDPFNVNLSAVADDFIGGVYGPGAGPLVRRYLDTMEESFRVNDRTRDYRGFPNTRGAVTTITLWNAVYSNTTLIESGRLLKQAEAIAASPWYADNVRQAMLPVQYVVLMRWAQLQTWAARSNVAWPFAPTAAEEFALFNITFVRTRVSSVTQMVEWPATVPYTCNLLCLRNVMLGY